MIFTSKAPHPFIAHTREFILALVGSFARIFSRPLLAAVFTLPFLLGSPAPPCLETALATSTNSTSLAKPLANDIPENMDKKSSETNVPLCNGKVIPITLEECVALVMRRNVNIRVAYLERVLDKFNLVTDTAYEFAPNVSITGTLKRSKTDSLTDTHTNNNDTNTASYSQDHSTTLTDSFSVSPTISGLIPTGARYSMSWGLDDSRVYSRTKTIQSGVLATGWDPTNRRGLENTLNFSISQPLLKGAGLDYNLVPVQQAIMTERVNVLQLKRNIIGELTSAIGAYRSLLSAKWSVGISANALERSRENLEMAKVKIDLGKMAALDIVQYESDEANRELSLEQALDSYNSARLNLLMILNMDRDTCLEPSEDLDFSPLKIDGEELRRTIRDTRPEYLTRELNLRSSELDLLQAKRDQLWDLSLVADGSLNNPSGSTDARWIDTRTSGQAFDWSIGLELSFPIFGSEERSLRRQLLQAQSTLHVNRIEFKKAEEDMFTELEQMLSNIHLLERQVELSHRARLLADKKVEVERIKLQKGRSSTFQLVSFQDDQFSARESELSSRISYLDALASLDSYLGTTMETWGIEFKNYRKEAEEEIGSVKWGVDPDDLAPALEPSITGATP